MAESPGDRLVELILAGEAPVLAAACEDSVLARSGLPCPRCGLSTVDQYETPVRALSADGVDEVGWMTSYVCAYCVGT
jgi:hypothetical protein